MLDFIQIHTRFVIEIKLKKKKYTKAMKPYYHVLFIALRNSPLIRAIYSQYQFGLERFQVI